MEFSDIMLKAAENEFFLLRESDQASSIISPLHECIFMSVCKEFSSEIANIGGDLLMIFFIFLERPMLLVHHSNYDL